ncbi:hypothetical protein CEXT_592341 [Caerostris extrusa]|uniref:Uncharacterized protein n=1 Tax=Caerostris extrusa TaxID=172846 RepID=A0AAV4XWM3_CAEEX|nr:hypothetical protein CEXT_592341 [Caerostris extrusa]
MDKTLNFEMVILGRNLDRRSRTESLCLKGPLLGFDIKMQSLQMSFLLVCVSNRSFKMLVTVEAICLHCIVVCSQVQVSLHSFENNNVFCIIIIFTINTGDAVLGKGYSFNGFLSCIWITGGSLSPLLKNLNPLNLNP